MAIFLAMIPFGVFMGVATQFGIESANSTYLLVFLYIITICFSYLGSLGGFALIQSNNCGKVKNMKQIAGNAGMSTLIITVFLTIAVFIPGLRGVVSSLFSPTIDQKVAEAVGYAYYLFWGGLYGFSTGAYMAAMCG
jgi:hypothetical protein